MEFTPNLELSWSNWIQDKAFFRLAVNAALEEIMKQSTSETIWLQDD